MSGRSELPSILRWLVALDGFVRLHALGFTLIWPLLGAAATSSAPIWDVAPGLLWICLCYNTGGYLLNNVVDLDVDRTHPDRVDQWLVTNAVSTRTALVAVALQLPLMLALHLLFGFPPTALGWLVTAISLIVVYDVWGKRCSIPLLMDGCLGLAGFALTYYGAALTRQPVSLLVGCVALSSVAYLLLVNAFHNGLRDVDNDARNQQQTTALWFGSRGTESSRVHVPPAMFAYGTALQAILIALAAAACALASTPAASVAAVAATGLLGTALFAALMRARKPAWGKVLRVHLFVLPLPLLAALAHLLDAATASLLAGAYLAPLVLLRSGQRFFACAFTRGFGVGTPEADHGHASLGRNQGRS
jgi:4-hydroxybenzoate polyprenyltransferase